MSKLKNSANFETEISTPNSRQVPLASPKDYKSNYKSFQGSECQGSIYGKNWDPSSSRNSLLGMRKSSQKVIHTSNQDKLIEEKKKAEIKRKITKNKRKSKMDDEINKVLNSVSFSCEFF